MVKWSDESQGGGDIDGATYGTSERGRKSMSSSVSEMSNRTGHSGRSRASVKSVLSRASVRSALSRVSLGSVISMSSVKSAVDSFVGARPSSSRAASLRSVSERQEEIQLITSQATKKKKSPAERRLYFWGKKPKPLYESKLSKSVSRKTPRKISKPRSLRSVKEEHHSRQSNKIASRRVSNPPSRCSVKEEHHSRQSNKTSSIVTFKPPSQRKEALPAEQRDDMEVTASIPTESNRNDKVKFPNTHRLVVEGSNRDSDTGNSSTLGHTSTFDTLDDEVEQEIRKFKKLTLSEMMQLAIFAYADNLFDLLENKEHMPEKKRHGNDEARRSRLSKSSKHVRPSRSMDEDTFLSDATDATDWKDRESALYSIGKSFVDKALDCLPEMCTGATGAHPIERTTEEPKLAEPKGNPCDNSSSTDSSRIVVSRHDLERKRSLLKKVLPLLRMRTSKACSQQTEQGEEQTEQGDDPPVRFIDIAKKDSKNVDMSLDGENRGRSFLKKVRPSFHARTREKSSKKTEPKSDPPFSHVDDSNADVVALETSMDQDKDKIDLIKDRNTPLLDKRDDAVVDGSNADVDVPEMSGDDDKDKRDLSIDHKDALLSEPKDDPSVAFFGDSNSDFDAPDMSLGGDKDKTDCSANHKDKIDCSANHKDAAKVVDIANIDSKKVDMPSSLDVPDMSADGDKGKTDCSVKHKGKTDCSVKHKDKIVCSGNHKDKTAAVAMRRVNTWCYR